MTSQRVSTPLESKIKTEIEAVHGDASSKNSGQKAANTKHGWDFWLVFLVICMVSFIAALESTIITTALPRISESIAGADSRYIWIANSFILCSTVFQPLYGQLCAIFGRRRPYIVSLSFFIFGSGLCGGLSTVGSLIAGRTIQGIGSAGMFVVSDLIICDLVPLRQRAKYMGAVLAIAAFGAALGPVIGGALAAADWRWCFYIHLPIGVPCLALIIVFSKLQHKPQPKWRLALARLDWIGSLIFIPSTLSLLLGLVLGGHLGSPWSSWHTILPLVLGVCGWAIFHTYEASRFCANPSLPPHLFGNRTTATALLLTFLAGTLFNWSSFFFPFYFQALLNASSTLSGVYMLPMFTVLVIASGVAGFALSKFGRYKPLHWAGFALITAAMGLASTLNATSSSAAWILAEILASAGVAILLTTILPVVLAPLSEKDVAAGTAAFGFFRSLGLVFGMTIPAAVFNNAFDANASAIGDVRAAMDLADGAAYGFAVSSAMQGLEGTLRQQVIETYAVAIQYVWYIAIAFSGLGFIAVFVEQTVELRRHLETEFGLAGGEDISDTATLDSAV